MNGLKTIFIIFSLLAFIFEHEICIAGTTTKPKYIWKMADVAPDGVGYSIYLGKTFSNKINKVTNGDIRLIWYHGCIMGDEEDYIAKIRINQLQGAGLSTGGCLMICPEFSVLQLPFLFKNFDEVDYIRIMMRPKFSEMVTKNGFKMLLLVDQDFDQIYSTKYEMKTHEDFKNSKFVTHAGFLEYKMVKALGASPIPLGFPEIASAMRAGVIDAGIWPPLWNLGTQLYTLTKHVNPLKWRYSPGIGIVSLKAWNKLPEKHKIAINKVLRQLEVGLNTMSSRSNSKAYKAMIDYGHLKEVVMSKDEIEEFKKNLMPIWNEVSGKKFPKKLLDEVIFHLNTYRK